MPPRSFQEDNRYGRSQTKNFALAAWHAPLGGCIEDPDLRRGQGFRRAPPTASSRPQDRHVQGPAGLEEQEGVLIAGRSPCRGGGRVTWLRLTREPCWLGGPGDGAISG